MTKKTIVKWVILLLIAMILGSILMRMIRDAFIAMGILFVVLVVIKVLWWKFTKKKKTDKTDTDKES